MEVDSIFNEMVDNFKRTKSKLALIEIMINYCKLATTTPQNVYDLKKKLELEFSIEVDCVYCYKTKTPDDYGCDLREILYDRTNHLIEGGEELLQLFETKKLPTMWHIMTDIDDTLYPNTEHNTYIAGSDRSWNQKTPYPGIMSFYNIFYEKVPKKSKYTTILSATPGCLKNMKLHNKLLHKILPQYGFIQGPESKYQVMSHVPNVVSNLFTNCNERFCGTQHTTSIDNISSLFTLFGNTKYERCEQYLKLFPEYNILFIGDNGQGDVLAGIQMLTNYNDRCTVFIHKVSIDGIKFKNSDEEDQDIKGLHFFTNYFELAQKFQELEIFNDRDVDRVKQTFLSKIRENGSNFGNLYSSYIGGKLKRTTKNKKLKTKKKKNKKYSKKN